MQMADELLRLDRETKESLILNMYIRSPTNAVKLWLAVDIPLDDMCRLMLFRTLDLGYISTQLFLQIYTPKMDHEFPDFSIWPETNPDRLDRDLLKAIKITRLAPASNLERYADYSRYAYSPYLDSFDIFFQDELTVLIIPAAIVDDDCQWLDRLSTDPKFTYGPEYIDIAARFGSIKCFKFLSLNGCQIDDDTFLNACQGGNEEIIQLCLENGCKPTDEAVEFAIHGQNENVAKWLIEIHNVKIEPHNLITCVFSSGCWQFFADYCLPEIVQYAHNTDIIKFCELWETVLRMDIWRVPRAKLLLMIPPRYRGDFHGQMACKLSNIVALDSLDVLSIAGFTAIDFAIVTSAFEQGCRRLMRMIAEDGLIDIRNDNGETPLMLIVQSPTANDNVAKNLVTYGADVNAAYPTGKTVLMLAIESRYCSIPIIQYLVDHGADVNATDENGRTAFMYAASCRNSLSICRVFFNSPYIIDKVDDSGHTAMAYFLNENPGYDVIYSFLKAGADPKTVNDNGDNLIHLFFRNLKTDTPAALNYIIGKGVDPLVPDPDGVTPLMLALHGPFDKDIITTLLWYNHGEPDLTAVDEQGRSLLHHIMFSQKPDDAIESIFENPPEDINIRDNAGITPLMLAAQNGQSGDFLRELISQGASPDLVDNNGMNAFMYAATNPAAHFRKLKEAAKGGYEYAFDFIDETYHVLFPTDSIFRATDKMGRNALIHAVTVKNNVAFIAWLQSRGFSLDSADVNGKTALMYAVAIRKNCDNATYLATNCSNPCAVDSEGRNAMMYLMKGLPPRGDNFRMNRLFGTLVQAGIDINAETPSGMSVLFSAITHNKQSGVELLRSHGVPIDSPNKDGTTGLMLACRESMLPMIKTLVQMYANVNAVDYEQKTPLMYAVLANRDNSVLDFLVKNGADVNATDLEGHSAVYYASEIGNPATIDFLKQHGASVAELECDSN